MTKKYKILHYEYFRILNFFSNLDNIIDISRLLLIISLSFVIKKSGIFRNPLILFLIIWYIGLSCECLYIEKIAVFPLLSKFEKKLSIRKYL
jgi:hypothetical protein